MTAPIRSSRNLLQEPAGRRTRTAYAITDEGRRVVAAWLAHALLEELVSRPLTGRAAGLHEAAE